jgi:hypothetical protein
VSHPTNRIINLDEVMDLGSRDFIPLVAVAINVIYFCITGGRGYYTGIGRSSDYLYSVSAWHIC